MDDLNIVLTAISQMTLRIDKIIQDMPEILAKQADHICTKIEWAIEAHSTNCPSRKEPSEKGELQHVHPYKRNRNDLNGLTLRIRSIPIKSILFIILVFSALLGGMWAQNILEKILAVLQ